LDVAVKRKAVDFCGAERGAQVSVLSKEETDDLREDNLFKMYWTRRLREDLLDTIDALRKQLVELGRNT